MAARLREHDWSATLGPPGLWSSSLKTMVRMALTTGHPIFIFWGTEHICLYNDAYRASLGPEKHPAILGARGRDAWPEIWDLIGPQIDLVLAGQGATWHENQLVPILRHGAIQNVYWTYSYGPIDDESKTDGIGGVLVICSETTPQVLTQRQLVAERERFAQLFDQAPTFMAFLTGHDHVIELANPGFLTLVGNRPVMGRTVAAALPEAVEQGFLELLNRVYRDGETYAASSARYDAHMPNGTTIERFLDFVYQPIKDRSGAVTGIFVVGVDVTERTLSGHALDSAQAQLLTSEEQLRLATDAGEIGLWDLDVQTDSLFWPARVKAMFGISPDQPVSLKDFYAGLHPEDVGHVNDAFSASMDPAQRKMYDVEFRTIGKEDGVVRWLAAKGAAFFDNDGRCVRAIGTAIDITRRMEIENLLKEGEVRLRAALDALQDADRKKDEFLATLSHELRNPLATLRTSLTLLARAGENRVVTERARHIMERQVEQLVRLTDDLLDVRRITLGKMNLRRKTVSLAQVLELASECCITSVQGAGQRIEMVAADPSISIDGDSARLVQLFGNLIGNASKFSPAGGRIQVTSRLQEDTVRVCIKDWGIGLAADELLCVFEPFTQLESSGARSHSGLGIGLALAKQLAELHGGSIEARSAGHGHGSEFIVVLPLLRDDIPVPKLSTAD